MSDETDKQSFNSDEFDASMAKSYIKQAQSELSYPIVDENSSVQLLTATGQFYVMDVDDKYIVRFPKEHSLNNGNSQSLEELKEESKITKSILPYINKTKISDISVLDGARPFAVHEKIKGDKLTKKDFNLLTDEQKNLYAKDLAVFLAELHAVPIDKTNLPDRKDLLFNNTAENQATLNKYGLSLHQDVPQNNDLVCCHNDMHAGNVGVDLNKQHILQGVFDFGMCGIAERSGDFYKIFDFDKTLCKDVIEQYNKISPQKVNLHSVENQYLSWCATNIRMAEGKHPQIVSAVEAKLQDFKQYQSTNNRLNAVRNKLHEKSVSSKSIAELRGLKSPTTSPYKPQKTSVNSGYLKLFQDKKQNG